MEKCETILADIAILKNIIKRHMDALKALEVADTEMLVDLDDLECIFKEEVSVMEKEIKARELAECEE